MTLSTGNILLLFSCLALTSQAMAMEGPMLDHDTPLERPSSRLSNDALDDLLQGLWSKLATVGARALMQDESSPRLATWKLLSG